ncbi:MAG: hypothetical protein AB2653_08810, partial [Candidatus Thiodiazotropha endolucinida]
MKTVMKTTIRMPLSYAILGGLILIAAVTLYLFFGTEDPKLSTIIGGICGGVIVYIISFLISIYEYRSIDRFRELGVKEVLPNRRGTDYYAELLGEASEIVVVTGTSCSRFIDDFANNDNDDHVLLDALRKNKGLNVKLMVPLEKYMDELSKTKFASGEEKLRKLLSDFPGRIEMRRFNHEPRHSFVRVDKDLVVGPVFVETESQDSPAIHLDVNSAYAGKYLHDFDRVWAN